MKKYLKVLGAIVCCLLIAGVTLQSQINSSGALQEATAQNLLLHKISGVPGLTHEEQKDGSISIELIQKIRKENIPDSETYRIIDAVGKNGIGNVAINQSIINQHDPYFSHKIKTSSITDQKHTGRCWLFAGFNVLRPYALKKLSVNEFEFSKSYLFFWDKFEKSNTFLEEVIKRKDLDVRDENFQRILERAMYDGGQWNYFAYLIEKYGAVPKSVMPETEATKDSRAMNRLIKQKLVYDALELRQMNEEGASIDQMQEKKEEFLSEIYRMLCVHLGVPPTDFQFRYRPNTEGDKEPALTQFVTYTPQEFAEEFLIEPMEEYVVLANIPSRPYYKMYKVENEHNIVGTEDMWFLNLPISELKTATLGSILADEPVWFGTDVLQQVDRTSGIMHPDIFLYSDVYGVNMKMPKGKRILYGYAEPNHAMVFMGVDVVDGKPVKWLVENSWGKDVGKVGYLHMYDSYFDEYVIECVVRREFLPEKLMPILKTEPIIIKESDPLGKSW
jgi:bleomycin hydrolase